MKRGARSVAFPALIALVAACGATAGTAAPTGMSTGLMSPTTSALPTSIPSGPPVAAGSIAYVLGPEDARELRVISPDGTADRSCGTGSAPSWSADGSTLVFQRPGVVAADGLELFEVDRAAADGTGVARVLGNGAAPHLSPDGTRLTFGRGIIDTGDAWIAKSDGAEAQKLMAGTSPTWSPDGSWLLLNPAGGTVELGVIRPDGTDYRSLGPGNDPSWTPDGRIVYLRSDYPKDTATLRVIALDGMATDLAAALGEISSPRMLPDGRVIFIWNGDVWQLGPRSAEPVPLTHGLMAVAGPSVSADGRWAAVAVGGEGPGLAVVSMDGGWVQVLDGVVSAVAWQPVSPTE